MSIADKLTTLIGTKTEIKNAIIEKGQTVNDKDTFRSYADKIRNITTSGNMGTLDVSENGTYNASSDGYDGYTSVTVNVSGGSGGGGGDDGGGGSGGGDGGDSSSITVEELTVTENGTYTAEEGKAYSPVRVSVPSGNVGFGWGYDVQGTAKEAIEAGASVYLAITSPENAPEKQVLTSGQLATPPGNETDSIGFGKCSVDGRYYCYLSYERVSGTKKTVVRRVCTDQVIRDQSSYQNYWTSEIVSAVQANMTYAINVLYTDYVIFLYRTNNIFTVYDVNTNSIVRTGQLNFDLSGGTGFLHGTKVMTRYKSGNVAYMDIASGGKGYTTFDLNGEYLSDTFPISEEEGFYALGSGKVGIYRFVKGGSAELGDPVANFGATPAILWDNQKYLYVLANKNLYRIYKTDSGTWENELIQSNYVKSPFDDGLMDFRENSYIDKFGKWGILSGLYWHDVQSKQIGTFTAYQTTGSASFMFPKDLPFDAPDMFAYKGTWMKLGGAGIYNANNRIHGNDILGYSPSALAAGAKATVKVLFD